jgi:hypothetical protein
MRNRQFHPAPILTRRSRRGNRQPWNGLGVITGQQAGFPALPLGAGAGVVGGPAALDLGDVLLGPGFDRVDGGHQAHPERGERVVDRGGHARRQRPGDQPVAFQRAQRLGERLLAHPGDDQAQVAVQERVVLGAGG